MYSPAEVSTMMNERILGRPSTESVSIRGYEIPTHGFFLGPSCKAEEDVRFREFGDADVERSSWQALVDISGESGRTSLCTF